MSIEACGIPSSGALDRELVEAAYFRDAYCAPLRRQHADIIEIFFAIFAHHPKWMKMALVARNRLALSCGLDAPTASEIMNLPVKSSYAVGEKIGVWPIFALTPNEVVAGRNNKHLDFRLSVLKKSEGENGSVVVSTICNVHNGLGKVYLFFIVPFHRWGVRLLLSRAIGAGRL